MTLIRLIVFAACCFSFVLFPANLSGAYSYGGVESALIDSSRTKDPEIKALSGALAHYVMGTIYDNFGDTEAAVAQYKKALAYKKDIGEIYLNLGSDFLLLGKFDEASETLNQAVVLDPESVKSYLLLAIIHTAKGEFEKAQQQYEEALRHDPENLKVLTFLSDLFVVQQKLDKAAEVYEKILRIRKDDAFIYFNLGIIYSKLDLLDKAEENLQKAIEVDEDYFEAQMVLGFIYEVEGKYAEAIKQYKKVAEVDELNRDAHVRLGQLYYRMGRTDDAIAENRILMQLDTHSPEPYLRNFSIYVSGKDYGKAQEVLDEALQKGISTAVIYASLGYLASLEKDYKKAVDYYTVAAEKDPASAIYRFYSATALDRSGRREEALKVLEEIVSGEGAIAEAYNYLGYLYAEEGRDLDRAVTLIKKALAIDPANGAYVDSLGWAYYKKGMMDEALEELNKAAELIPDDAVIRDHLGDVYFAGGELEKAAREWEMAIKLDPGDKKISKKLEKIKVKLKNKSK
ncbi:tetratricopeptide repeat protein [Candidatus Omnitrophota bacterium]